MSLHSKKVARIGTKVVASFLLVLLVIFNIQIGIYENDSSGIYVFGFSLSVSTPSAMAGESCCPEEGSICVFGDSYMLNYTICWTGPWEGD